MQPCPPERQDPASSTRIQAPVPSTRKPAQPTEPTLPTAGRHQKQKEQQTCSLRKGDPKRRKLSKMRRQRNTQQMKDQGKNPPHNTNEEEIGSLPEKEFRVMIVKIQNLGNRMEKIQETFNEDLEELKSKQTMMNKTINEIENSLQGINSRITEAEERIRDLEDKIVEITTTEQNKEKRMKRIEESLRDLWDNTKCTNIQIIGVPEEEAKKKGTEKTFEEVIFENFPNMGKEIVNQVQEAQSPIQGKSKEKYAKTHINQTIKN